LTKIILEKNKKKEREKSCRKKKVKKGESPVGKKSEKRGKYCRKKIKK